MGTVSDDNARPPGGLIADSVQLPWSAALYGALAGAVAAVPVAGLALADSYAAIVAFFGQFWTAAYCGLLSLAVVASDYLLPSWPRARRWGSGAGVASLLVVSWVASYLRVDEARRGSHIGIGSTLRMGVWILMGAALSALYGRVLGVAASQRADGRRLGAQMGALVAFIYVGLDVLFGGPVRRAGEGAAMLISWALLVVTAGALLGLVLAWHVRAAARRADCEPLTADS